MELHNQKSGNPSVQSMTSTNICDKKPRDLRPLALGLITTLAILGTTAGTAHAAVGAKMGVQIWDPTQLQHERVEVPYDSASSISDAVIQAWDSARGPLCAMIKAELGKADRFAKGVTLGDIDCTLKPSQEFSARQVGPNELEFTYAVRGNTLIATSTTPSTRILGVPIGVGDYLDPRVSVDFDFVLRLRAAFQPATDTTLQITEVHARFEKTKIDSQNAVADIAKAANAAWDWLGGTNFQAKAENMLNSISTESQYVTDATGARSTYGESLKARANALLKPVNQALAAPANYVKIGAWFDKNKVVLAFSPRNIPLPQANATISGHIRWPSGWTADRGCDSFKITSRVQTAPSPILGPNLALGKAPVQEFGQFMPIGTPVQVGDKTECQYRLTGVPAMFGNELVALLPNVKQPGQKPVSTSASVFTPFTLPSLRKDGWSEDYVVPPTNNMYRDYLVEGITVNPTVLQVEKKSFGARPMPGGPVEKMARPKVGMPILQAPAIHQATKPIGSSPIPLPPGVSTNGMTQAGKVATPVLPGPGPGQAQMQSQAIPKALAIPAQGQAEVNKQRKGIIFQHDTVKAQELNQISTTGKTLIK